MKSFFELLKKCVICQSYILLYSLSVLDRRSSDCLFTSHITGLLCTHTHKLMCFEAVILAIFIKDLRYINFLTVNSVCFVLNFLFMYTAFMYSHVCKPFVLTVSVFFYLIIAQMG